MNSKRSSGVVQLAILVGLILFACGSVLAQDVKYNFMPGTDFAKYHTYKWVVIEGGSHPNQIADAQIKSSVDSPLAAEGLTKTDGDKADLLIGYQVAVDKEKTVERIRYRRPLLRRNGNRNEFHDKYWNISSRSICPND
jgi:uncharacterized protein DUF4136